MIGCVVLTQGGRPAELAAGLASLQAQRGVELDVLVIGNAWEPTGLPAGVRALALPENLGAAGGRNAGAAEARGELLFFLDDDAQLVEPDTLARVAARFAAEADLGLLQLGVAPSDGGRPPRDWVPRLRVGDRRRPGEVTAVWEGAVAVRRALFERVGGWPAAFGISHEGVDLAWRVMDAGFRVHYAGDLLALHPAYAPASKDYSPYVGARNRVYLARRHLPAPLGVVYVASFALRSLPLLRTRRRARAALRGYRDGLRTPCGPRRPLKASTLWRMTRAGRPPIV